ncbi:MAG: acyl-CoA dehydrogenase family protein [Pseudomonadota bacterium]
MDFSFTRQQEMLTKMVREFAEKELAPNALSLDEKGEFPYDIIKKMAQLGLVGIVSPKEYGGTEMGHVARMIAIEEVSRIYPPVGFFFQAGQLGIYMFQSFGTDEQKNKYLTPLCKAEKVSCTAVTEQTGGSDPSAMQTTAELVGDEYVINGRKVFITLGGVADICCFVAKTGDKFSAFFVEKGTPGYEIGRREHHSGMRCIPVNELIFTNCKIPKSNLIGQEGRGLVGALTVIAGIGRTGAAGIALGAARGSYEAAVKFAKERELYGKPIINLQGLQFMLADMNVEIEAAKWLCYNAEWLLDQGKSTREISSEIARAKVFSCEVAIRTNIKAIQVLGGYGTTPEYHVVRRLRDSIELLAAGGTQEIMRLTIGRSIMA